MVITSDMRLADVIHLNYLVLPVYNRFGIHLGFGNSSIEEICSTKEINLDFFLEILNTFHDPEYFPKKHLQSFPVKLIAEYLSQTHKYYLLYLIPEIETKISFLVSKYPEQSKQLTLIQNFFVDYKNELIFHIEREEKKVFPYVKMIEKAFLSKSISTELMERMQNYSINEYLEEHDDIEEKLLDLKNIIIKYLPEIEDNNLTNAILFDLFNLERDMNNHARIEDKVMIPKIVNYEKELRKDSTK